MGIVMMFSVAMAADQKPATPPAKNSPGWVVVFTAKYGEIVRKTRGYELVFQRKDIDSALSFSDQPTRLVDKLNATELDKLWKTGKNSFANYSPSAAIIINGQTQLVILRFIIVTEDKVSFVLTTLQAPIKLMSGKNAALFIDATDETDKIRFFHRQLDR